MVTSYIKREEDKGMQCSNKILFHKSKDLISSNTLSINKSIKMYIYARVKNGEKYLPHSKHQLNFPLNIIFYLPFLLRS